jgi:hypothetical protein
VVSGWDSAIIWGKRYQGVRNPGKGKVYPRSVIRSGPKPMPSMGMIPVTMIEENGYINVRDYIHIRPRYYNHGGRSRDAD